MSYKITDAVWERAAHRGETMMVLLALATYASDEGVCWPAQETLAKRARCSVRGLRKILGKLVESGDIEVVEQGGAVKGRGHFSSVYRLSPYIGGRNPVPGVEERGSGSGGTGCRESRNRVPGVEEPSSGSGGTPFRESRNPVPPNLSSESVSESVNEAINESARARETLKNRIGAMFGREAGSSWSKAEMISLEAVESLGTTDADIEALMRYYRSSISSDKDYRRRTVGSLLEHWHGELDRARSWVREQRRKANSIL